MSHNDKRKEIFLKARKKYDKCWDYSPEGFNIYSKRPVGRSKIKKEVNKNGNKKAGIGHS